MLPDRMVIPYMSAADAERLKSILRRKFTGSGGIEVNDTDDGVSIILVSGSRRGVGATPHEHFAVRVWRDGGTTDGDATHQCNRTYTVRTLEATGPSTGGVLLGSAMSPDKLRQALGAMVTPATTGAGVRGVGYYDGATFRLWDANEVPNVEACP